jgi:hypothetical protein
LSICKGLRKKKAAETVQNGMSGNLRKCKLKFTKGKTPGVKVEDGTGFKVFAEKQDCIPKDFRRKSRKSLRKRMAVTKVDALHSPETPTEGEIVRNPKEGSTYSGDRPWRMETFSVRQDG